MKQLIFQTLTYITFSLFLATSALSAPLRIGMVLDKGGRDDKSFNAAAFKGGEEAKKQLGIHLKVVESSDDTALEPNLRTFAQKGYDLVIGIGFVQLTPMEKVAKEFPKTRFLIVDSPLSLPNVRSVIFKEHEGSFLVGAIAAMTTKTKNVGFIGGMDIPLIRRFQMGYEAGVKAIDPGIKVRTNYVGSSSDAWKNPMKGKELALNQINQNVDIIFQAAGASGLGVFDAIEEKHRLVIGCDSNQNWVKPGRVLTSMLKRVDLAVFNSIESLTKGTFQTGEFSLGIKEGMIDFAVDEHNAKLLTPTIQKQAESLRTDIVKGKIQVPDFYVLMKKGKG